MHTQGISRRAHTGDLVQGSKEGLPGGSTTLTGCPTWNSTSSQLLCPWPFEVGSTGVIKIHRQSPDLGNGVHILLSWSFPQSCHMELNYVVWVQPPLVAFPPILWEGQWGEAKVLWKRAGREMGGRSLGDQSLKSELSKCGSALRKRNVCWLVLWPVVHMQRHHLCWKMCMDFSKRAPVKSVSELELHL